MGQFTKRTGLPWHDSSWPQAVARLVTAIVSSPDARHDVLRLVVTVAMSTVIIAALVAAVLIARPELITTFASVTVSR